MTGWRDTARMSPTTPRKLTVSKPTTGKEEVGNEADCRERGWGEQRPRDGRERRLVQM